MILGILQTCVKKHIRQCDNAAIQQRPADQNMPGQPLLNCRRVNVGPPVGGINAIAAPMNVGAQKLAPCHNDGTDFIGMSRADKT